MSTGPDEHDMTPFVELLGSLGVAPEDVPDTPQEASEMAADVVISRSDVLSARQLAEASGTDTESARQRLQHLGIRIDDPDTVLFDEQDVELVRFLEVATDILTEDEGVELLHVAGTALGAIAEAAVSGHVQGPESRSVDWLDNARLNAAMSEMGLELARHLATAFRHHLRQAALRQRRTQSHAYREVQELTVGFVDLVGFTSLSQVLEPDKIVALVSGFERQAHELAHHHGTRVVKLIGDEVMFVAENPADAALFAVGMLRSFATADVVPRGGVASGSLVNVHGDYFGPVVNLAARLVDTAVPGEILVDDNVAEACRRTTEPAGRRMLKGFEDPVRVHSLLPGD